jgi:hypothetical protein
MQVTLFRALQSIKLDDDKAEQTVDAIEEHIAMKITEANAALVAEIKSLNAQIIALRWLVGSVGLIIAAVTAAGAIFN